MWTYKEAMVPERLPGSLLVVGAGAIGIEFASFYHDMGAEVTVVEALPRILPAEDEEIAALAHKIFEKRGIHIHTGGDACSRSRRSATTLTAVIDLGGGMLSPVTVERVILAVGITGNVEDIGLETTRVRGARRGTSSSTNGSPPPSPASTPSATSSGRRGWRTRRATRGSSASSTSPASKACSRSTSTSIPACTYCRPQIASVGLTEAAARANGREVRVGRFPYQANGKAIALGEPRGPREDDLRRRDRRAARRAPDRRPKRPS